MPVVISDLNPRARALVIALRKIRTEYGITSRDLSSRMGFSHAFVSHWETGRRVPRPEEVNALLAELSVTGAERDRIMQMARAAAEPSWIGGAIPGVPDHVMKAVDHERCADAVTEWAPTTIPALLQISDYARAQCMLSGLAYTDTESRVLIRAGRREVVCRGIEPIAFTALIGENALREPVGTSMIMVEQLNYLVESAGRPNITIQIVPSLVGWHPGLVGAFTLYHFADSPEILYFEHYSSGVFLSDSHDIGMHHRALDIMRDKALSEAESIKLIIETAKKWARADMRDHGFAMRRYR
ncbi:MAG TPA: helix-turn-helix transcriptional regulator [Pseudonocardiaceae bacterium]|nr:helix-turn-helix transcriptional regulator [Pseudonocardiaceae bacterium]